MKKYKAIALGGIIGFFTGNLWSIKDFNTWEKLQVFGFLLIMIFIGYELKNIISKD